MFGILLLILIVIGLFKLTGIILHAVGRILGGVLGIFGWLVLAGLAATVFGFGLFMFAIILIVGAIALIISVMT